MGGYVWHYRHVCPNVGNKTVAAHVRQIAHSWGMVLPSQSADNFDLMRRALKTTTYILASIGIASVAIVAIPMCVPSLRPHLLRLLGRSWTLMVSATSNNTLGFLLWTLGVTVVCWMGTVAERCVKSVRQHDPHPVLASLRQSAWAGLFTIGGVVSLVIVSWITAAAFAVYYDHQSLARRNRDLVNAAKQRGSASTAQVSALQGQVTELQGELEFRKHNLGISDPVTQNVYEVIHGFRQLRDLIGKDGECYIKVTAPADTLEIAAAFAQLAGVVSGCKRDGPRAFNGDVNEEKAAMAGSVDGRVLIYAAKDSKVWGPLGSVDLVLPLDKRYNPPSPQENFMWFQFGHNSHWGNGR
jgi:hypothetical protein